MFTSDMLTDFNFFSVIMLRGRQFAFAIKSSLKTAAIVKRVRH